MILGIDASTLGSGGVQRHLIEIIRFYDPAKHGFQTVKIWGTEDVLEQIPESAHIIKFSHSLLKRASLSRYIWQLCFRDRSFKEEHIDVLFNPIGTYIGKFRPYATMSRNMIIFDKDEQKRFGWSLYRLKFIILFYIQRASFNNSQAIIFISDYARKYIEKFVSYHNKKTLIIHHGISSVFQKEPSQQLAISNYSKQNPYKFLYVSTVFSYKHHLHVVEVISRLRNKGYPVIIQLVGGIGQKEVGKILQRKIDAIDPKKEFISWYQNVGLKDVVAYYHSSDGFIFASSCENMPNILIEAMASGLPIACSKNSPMPEFLEDAGLYFDPENQNELEEVLTKMLEDNALRKKISFQSFTISKKYGWDVCAEKTFKLLFTLGSNK